MRIRIAAWRLRNRARAALRAGDPGSAVALAGEATRLHSTPAGCALHALAAAVSAADTFARQRDRSVRVRFLEAEIARAERAEAEAIRARDEAVAECASQKRATGGRPGVEPTVRRAPRAAPSTWVHRIWSIWRRHRK
jgi:hypothetical protein